MPAKVPTPGLPQDAPGATGWLISCESLHLILLQIPKKKAVV